MNKPVLTERREKGAGEHEREVELAKSGEGPSAESEEGGNFDFERWTWKNFQ